MTQPHDATPLRTALLEEISQERARQITQGNWTVDHDDAHTRGELARAGAAFATTGRTEDAAETRVMTDVLWPFNRESFKPHGYRHNLLRAQALLLAEMERIERLADTVQYFRVPGPQGAFLYYAADRDTLITLLATSGQPVVTEDITELPGTAVYPVNEAHTRSEPLRELFMDRAGTVDVLAAAPLLPDHTRE